jgi:hypothetical protein
MFTGYLFSSLKMYETLTQEEIDFSHNFMMVDKNPVFQLQLNLWPYLVSVSFAYNNINASLEVSTENNVYVRQIDLSHNPLTGSLASDFALLNSLSYHTYFVAQNN